MSTLAFRNHDQAALFDLELKGQISDGHWENASPYNHYEPWCRCNVVVDDGNVGRDFYARRDRYAFDNEDLLEVVEKRMIGAVRLARRFGLDQVKRLGLHWGIECGTGELMPHTAQALSPEVLKQAQAALREEPYTERDLKRDLRDMKQIVKVRRAP